jgi:hypothetical protein
MHSTDPKTIRIGVLADTHVPHRIPALPARVCELLRGSDMILHAGDLETPDVLDELRTLGPPLGVHAVRGNLHWQFSTGVHDQDLPRDLTLSVGPHMIWMSHGHLHFGYSVIDKLAVLKRQPKLDTINSWIIARLARAKAPKANIVVFGHSHKACAVQHDGTLYFNPGAVTGAGDDKVTVASPSIGFLLLAEDGTVRYEWATV